jgi:L-threonylcarbamoyladenylate synthase
MPDISHNVIKLLSDAGIIAYPTEAVYGLGCNPFNERAIQRLLQIKRRSPDKGLILIASEWEQLLTFVEPINDERMVQVRATWPGPVTWVFPAKACVSTWLRGKHHTVAVRVTAHPIAKALCHQFGGALISTSANREGQPPFCCAAAVEKEFGLELDAIVEGDVGTLARPTEIRDAMTGCVLRSG